MGIYPAAGAAVWGFGEFCPIANTGSAWDCAVSHTAGGQASGFEMRMGAELSVAVFAQGVDKGLPGFLFTVKVRIAQMME